MDHPMNRLTLVVTGPSPSQREWVSPAETTSLMFLDSYQWLEAMIASKSELDIARVVLDKGAASSTDLLRLLVSCGEHFRGDVLLIGPDGGGFLSAIGRGGERILYSPTQTDVEFYLWAHGLVKPGQEHLVDHPVVWTAAAQG